MTKLTLNKLVVLGIAFIIALSSIGCAKETPLEEKKARIDVRSGSVLLDVYKTNGLHEQYELHPGIEATFYKIEISKVVATALEDETYSRINGSVFDNMDKGDQFVWNNDQDTYHRYKKVKN